jgi:hypothetical protein
VDDQQASQPVKLVIRIPASLADKIELARGADSISQFVRYAIENKLVEKGVPPKKNEIWAPSRKGKGGPKPKKMLK